MSIIGETEKEVCKTCKGLFNDLEKITIQYNKHQMSEEKQREFTDKINEIFDKYDVSTHDRKLIFGIIE